MAFINVALIIAILVFWLMDKPFKFGQVDALNEDTKNAINDIEYFAQYTRAFRVENENLRKEKESK
jgi:hypothetical protein